MNLLNYVNIDVGTASEYRESYGNTLPNVQYPFGNQAYVLQTNKQNGGWFYNPKASYTEGIRITNQPSPWLGDYGHLTLLPFTGEYGIDMHSSMSKMVKMPNTLSGVLNRYQTNFELVPTKVGAKIKIENISGCRSKMKIDCHEGMTEYILDKNKIYITNRNLASGEWSKNFRKFFCLKFNCDILDANTYSKHKPIKLKKCNEMIIELELDSSEYTLDLTSSYISIEEAYNTCEIQSSKSLSTNLTDVTGMWNKLLNTISIESDVDEKIKETFYSNLYRIFCYPRFISEQCIDGKERYYCFKDGRVYEGVMISDIGFWDVYRTSFPLVELLAPEIYQKILNALHNYYNAYGWLPRWLAPYERGIMPSTLVDSVISKAIIDEKLPPSAIESVIKNATVIEENNLFGRSHLKEYLKYGYIPFDISDESVSMSLDNYYSDYTIFKALEKLNDDRASEYKNRADDYKKLFDSEHQLFVSKNSSGKFKDKFNSIEWGTDFCESSAVQNCFNVVHDVKGVINLYGGNDQVKNKLDELFTEKVKYNTGKYGFEIHEITEYARTKDIGHFAISNQPSFIMPFWYLMISEEEKFHKTIDKTLQYFQNTEYGYPGDEDNGSLAAWYIWVNIGMYPFCPVDKLLEFKPQFKHQITPL